ncbi:MAG: hypothetical protein GXY58_11680, partial [Planctomycetaceae bacterium]|nr:hypothetical protein [Planctomycetaceae bacterium]
MQLWADEIVVESSVDASANTRTGPRLELHASTITFRPGADIITQEGDLVLDGVVALDEGAATLFSTGLGAGGSVHLGTLTGQRSDLTIQTGSGDILLDGTIDNLGSLTLNSSGITRLSGAIGSSAPIASLTTDAGGLTDLRGGHIHASTVELADTVVLTTDVTINATTVTFGGTVDADAAANDRTLTVNATGMTTFAGAVGNNQQLLSLTTDAPGETDLNGSPINATTVDFADAVVLTADVTINATTVTFGNTVDADAAANDRTLTVNATGMTTFADAVGNNQRLLSLTTDAAGTTDLNASLIQAATVSFADAVILTTDVTINATTVTFGNTVDADAAANDRTLTVNATGMTTFAGAVGNNQRLLSLTT